MVTPQEIVKPLTALELKQLAVLLRRARRTVENYDGPLDDVYFQRLKDDRKRQQRRQQNQQQTKRSLETDAQILFAKLKEKFDGRSQADDSDC